MIDLHNDTIIGLDGTHPVAWGDHQWFMDDHNLANMQAGSQFPKYKGSVILSEVAGKGFSEWEMDRIEECSAPLCLDVCKTGELSLIRMREYAHPYGSSYPY